MRKNLRKPVVLGTLVFVMFGLISFAITPVLAFSPDNGAALQVTLVPTSIDMNPVATGIPNTGTDAAASSGLGWVIWAILGISVIALIVALTTRNAKRSDI